jgi:hypothetical protein
MACIPVLDYQEERGTEQGTGDTERVQEMETLHECSLSPSGVAI